MLVDSMLMTKLNQQPDFNADLGRYHACIGAFDLGPNARAHLHLHPPKPLEWRVCFVIMSLIWQFFCFAPNYALVYAFYAVSRQRSEWIEC